MNVNDLCYLTADEAISAFKAKKLSPINSCFLFFANLLKKGNNKPQIGFSKLLRRWKEVWRRCIGIEFKLETNHLLTTPPKPSYWKEL